MIACIRVPYFAAAIHRQRQPDLGDDPLILVQYGGRRGRVYAVCAGAEAAGVRPGMNLSRARALCPEAQMLPALTSRVRQAVDELLLVLSDYGARIEAGSDPAQTAALYVDLGRLYPEQGHAIAVQISARFQALGFETAVGLAANRFTAQIAAATTTIEKPTGQITLVPLGEEAAFLAPLPVCWLPLDSEQARRLDLLGLRQIGQIAALPRGALADQFGRPGILLHQLAHGEDNTRIARFTPPVVITAGREFDVALDNRLLIDGVFYALAAELVEKLDGQACQTVTLVAGLERGGERETQVRLPAPVSQGIGLARALQKLFDRLPVSSGVMHLTVQISDLVPVLPRQLSLFDQVQSDDPNERLIDLAVCYQDARFYRVVLTPQALPLPETRFRLEQIDVA